MNWDQIEVKWAAMARRVRSDLPQNARLASNQTPSHPKPHDLPEQAPAEAIAANTK